MTIERVVANAFAVFLPPWQSENDHSATLVALYLHGSQDGNHVTDSNKPLLRFSELHFNLN